MSGLFEKECIPCKGGVPPLRGAELFRLSERLGDGWKVVEERHLEKEFKFQNFREAMAFAVKVGDLAERVQHHPDLHAVWGKLKVQVWTHKIDGLTESDFIFAAKVDRQ